jgi:hypothetical protein
MGVDVSETFGFGCVFDRSEFLKLCKTLYDKECLQPFEEDCDSISALIGFYVEDSINVYSGQDWRKEIYVYLKYRCIGMKGGDVNVYRETDCLCTNEEQVQFLQQLEKLGFDKPLSSGYIFRTYLN